MTRKKGGGRESGAAPEQEVQKSTVAVSAAANPAAPEDLTKADIERILTARIRALEAELAEWREAKKFLGPTALREWRGVVALVRRLEFRAERAEARVKELETVVQRFTKRHPGGIR
jgi:hypothetical protein